MHVHAHTGRLQPRSVAILDGASIHKQRRFLHAVGQRGGRLLVLPPPPQQPLPFDNLMLLVHASSFRLPS